MASTMTADEAMGGTTIREPRIKERKDKSLSKRVLSAMLTGPRWVKRFIVKHKLGFAWALAALLALVFAAWLGWLVISFAMWLLAFNPVLFWLTTAVGVLTTVYAAYLLWVVWPKDKDAVKFTVETTPSPPSGGDVIDTEATEAKDKAKQSEDKPKEEAKVAKATAAPQTSRGAKPAPEPDNEPVVVTAPDTES